MAETYSEKNERLIKESFVEAFERLMQTKEFEDITTTEIVEESGLSRTTFYRHFKDKFDLAVWELQVSQRPNPKTVEDGDENIKNLVYYIAEHKLVFKKLFRYRGQNSFGDFFDIFSEQFIEGIANSSDRQLSLREKYVNRYHCMGSLAVIRAWILNSDALSKEEILDIIIAESRSPAVRKLYLSR